MTSFIKNLSRRIRRRSIASFQILNGPTLNIREGEVAVATYTPAVDKMKVFLAYIHDGIERGDWVFYLYPDEERVIVRAKLKEHGINVEKNEKNGTLYMKSLTEYFVPDGSFDVEGAIQFLLNRREEARRKGCNVREIEDVGDFSFLNGQWQQYVVDYWDNPKWGVPSGVGILYEPFIMELTAINVEHMTEQQIMELLKVLGKGVPASARFIDLIEDIDLFSRSIGLDHERLVGRRILLEFDPVSDYEKVVGSLAKESMANVEPLFVFTSSTSPIHTYLAEQPAVKFFLTSISTSIPKSSSENEMLLPTKNPSLILDTLNKVLETHAGANICVGGACRADANVCFVFDILSELLATIGREKTFTFLRHALDMLSSEKITSLFLLNTSAHQTEVVSRLRNLFSTQLAYDKNGLEIVKTS